MNKFSKMENTSDEGGSVDCGPSTPSTDLKEELVTKLTSFLQLYSQHQDHLQKTSEHFTQTAALLDMREKDCKITFLCGLFGGAFGLVCGGMTGGVGGAVGAAGAATYSLFCGDLTAFSATVGCVGSVVGGVVGGATGGAVSAAAIGTGSPGYSVVCGLFSPALGCAIGGCFDWSVGAAGGAAGAVLGVMAASCGAASLAREVRGLEEQKIKKKAHMTGTSLMEQLKTIKTICDQMVSGAGGQGVAEQTVKRPALRDEADEPQKRN